MQSSEVLRRRNIVYFEARTTNSLALDLPPPVLVTSTARSPNPGRSVSIFIQIGSQINIMVYGKNSLRPTVMPENEDGR